MPELANSIAVENLLQILIKVVGRRTTKEFAVTNIENILNRLQPKYDFLKYVKIENASFSEKKSDVKVESEIDGADADSLGKAINDIFDSMIKTMGKNVGYYYIKEIQEDLEKEIGSFFNEFEVNLNIKQQEHLLEIMQNSIIKIQDIKNSEVFNIVLTGIARLLNRKISESFTIDTVMDSIKKLEGQYDFLKFICIDEKRESQNPYGANINPEIDNILIAERGEVIQRILEEIGKASDLQARQFLGEKFEMVLDSRELGKIKRIGVKLDKIDKILRKEGHQLILSEIFQIILDVIEKKISIEFGVKYIDAMIIKIQDKHDILKYIKVDKSRLNEGMNAIEIMPEINSVDSYELGKAIKSILTRAQIDLKELTPSFIVDFEKIMDKQYLSEIDKMGVNLHILELRAS
jgi:translation elongation factor EF-1beta